MDTFAEALKDRYLLERELGRGGMAVVYLARDLKHDRPVALKILHQERAVSLGAERFQREIKVAASLQHPHVLSVYDSGETAGRLWFTMPYVQGESLRDRLRREGRLPVEDAVRIAREAAQGLAYAHKQKIVHRDVKPENILLTEDGSTLVADFGIARALNAPPNEELTQTGLIVGTPKYMAPEQMTGSDVDGRIDQYALAATLYETLTGTLPFTGSGVGFVRRITDPVPSVRGARAEVSPGVDEAIQRAMAFTPDGRFPSIAEFAKALDGSVGTTAPIPVGAPRNVWNRGPVWIGAIGLLALFAAGGLILSRRGSTPSVSRAGGATVPSVEASAPRLVVVPFENLGDAADAYFADGMTDEVRGKLSALPGLDVIARVSSSQYSGTRKTPQQIREELGVSYLLTGTVRWEKRSGTASRVRVSPELVDARSGVTKWQQPFDTTLTDVFEVQADIAGKVAAALNLTLAEPTRRQLAARSTSNPDAYALYLHGKELRAGDQSPEAARVALGEFQQAVTLDPAFAAGWAELALAYLTAFRSGGLQASDVQAARHAVEKAVALAPDAPDTHLAHGRYKDFGLGDHLGALAEYRAGLAVAPSRSDLLRSAAGVETKLGAVEEAAIGLEHAARLDPRSADVAAALGAAYVRLARYSEAATALDRARELRPSSVSVGVTRAMLAASQGNLAGVREELRSLERIAGRRRVIAFVALRENLLFALEDEQQRVLLDLTPADLDGGQADWALALAETSWLRGDPARARSYGETAAAAYARLLETWGEAADREQVMMLRAFSLGFAGRIASAITEGKRAAALEQQRGLRNPYLPLVLARIYVLAAKPNDAVAQLDEALRRRGPYSRAWLKIDSTLAPLRDHPRFEALVSAAPSGR